MKRKFLLLLMLSSCGEAEVCNGSDFETSQGICVFLNGHDIKKDDLSFAIDVTEKVVSERHPNRFSAKKLNDAYSATSIEFIPYVANKTDGYCKYSKGLLVQEEFRIVAEMSTKNNCQWYYVWIVPHELMHLYLINENNDDSHKKYWHWDDEDFSSDANMRSMQYEIYSELKPIFCNE